MKKRRQYCYLSSAYVNGVLLFLLQSLGAYAAINVASTAHAAISAADAERLGGSELTPMGSTRRGNDAGTVPGWAGGIKEPIPGSDPSKDIYPNPFPNEVPLFTITAKNYEQYKDNLSIGHQELLKHYPDSYYMKVYPSHRTHAWPQWVYERTKQQAQHVQMCGSSPKEMHCLKDYVAGGGIPFPIPNSAMEILWNSFLTYTGKYALFPGTRVSVVSAGGAFAYNTKDELYIYPWWMEDSEKPKGDYWSRRGGALFGLMQRFTGGPRLIGQLVGGLTYATNLRFDGYLYLPGQRRVRKAPEVGYYDQPGSGSDGLVPTDMRYGFFLTGDEQWFDWKIVGKKDVYVAYNSYDLLEISLHNTPVSFDKLLTAKHLDPQYMRYELHRVWVLEGKIRPEFRHLTPHIVLYVDEDSWRIPTGTRYDKDDRVWRISEEHLANYYDQPTTQFVGEGFYDLLSDRYGTYSFPQAGIDFGPIADDWFTPDGMRRHGVR